MAGPINVKLQKSRSVFSGPGRLFLCLVIIFASDGVSDTKAGQPETEHCKKSFNRQHEHRPPFQSEYIHFDSLAGFYVSVIHCNRRVTVPP